MSEFRSILLAIEVATRRRDDLARSLAQAQRNFDFGQGQLTQLGSYAADTDARWSGPRRRSGAAVTGVAIEMQTGVTENLQRQLGIAKNALMQAEVRLAGLNRVLEDRRKKSDLRQKRIEQIQTDEFAANLHARNRIAVLNGEIA